MKINDASVEEFRNKFWHANHINPRSWEVLTEDDHDLWRDRYQKFINGESFTMPNGFTTTGITLTSVSN